MALYDSLLTQAGGRQPGGPVTRPTFGGGSVQPSQPNSPAPPSPPAGAVGRPSSRPIMPSPPVAGPAPTTPAAPAATPAAPQTTGGPSTANRNPQPQAPGTRPSVPAPAPQPQGSREPAAVTTPSGGITLNLNKIPARSDYVGLLPGVAIRSPYGTHSVGADGKPTIQFDSPEHEMRYKTDEANYASKLSAGPLAGLPGAPRQPATLGRPAYDVWSGSWLNPE